MALSLAYRRVSIRLALERFPRSRRSEGWLWGRTWGAQRFGIEFFARSAACEKVQRKHGLGGQVVALCPPSVHRRGV